MAINWVQKLLPVRRHRKSYLRDIVTGSMYRISDMRGNSSLADIKTQIDTMRVLARDSQISTALAYYATDATTTNTDGNIIWAVPLDKNHKEAANVINACFRRWDINSLARDHILELATIGNLYIPTTDVYRLNSNQSDAKRVVLDNNTIPNKAFDIVPTYKIPPEDIIHIYLQGEPQGFIMQPDEGQSQTYIYPESSIIHFSLGGLLGDYTIDASDKDGNVNTYDIKFAQPMMEQAVTPTQTLSLLEDALLLNSLIRTVRFIAVECGDMDEDETRDSLQELKSMIEQQLSINTATGDTQSFVNPQSPNNLIYLPMINGQAPINITDLNLAETTDTDSKLLDYYEDKKLSVLGVPKEAMNFSSAEGLGGAGAVMSQRSALYANGLQRLQTAYISGWTDAMNKYFMSRNMSGFVNQFKLEMNPIITQLSTVAAERRDSAIGQATQIADLLKNLGVDDKKRYTKALQEALKDVFPTIGSDIVNWNIDLDEGGSTDEF